MLSDPYMSHLGIQTIEVQAGRAVLSAVVRPEHLNLHGFCHGGFLYSLADAAFALASNSHGIDAVALSTHMEYFKAVREGENIQAIASEENLGRKTATYRIELKRAEQIVALFTGTVYRMSKETNANG